MSPSTTPRRSVAVASPEVTFRSRAAKRLLSNRAKWAIVLALTLSHPILLLTLYPVVGDAINTMVLVGPVIATLLLGIRIGVLFIAWNTFVSGVVFWHLMGMTGSEGYPKAFVSLLVTTAVCWGADRLRHYIEQRREMEAALRQVQQIEAIGRLAAGVAHDINNTLNAIMGSTFALRHELASLGRPFQDLDNIALACDRGAQLTRNLLGFARKSCHRDESISLNAVVREVLLLLERTVHKNLRIETRLADPAPLMVGDEAQLEHAVMNLCLNAVDAMNEQGKLTITTSNEDGHVSVCVSDTGTGMDEEVRAHAFEPFFTTKPIGKGTGMGLSMVYGTVQAMHGSVLLDTELGVGTSITLSFPEAPVDTSAPIVTSTFLAEPRLLDGRTVLLVDDEPLVLRAGARMLRAMGCEVLTAKNGREGIDLFQTKRDEVSLAIIDLVMPDMDGVAALKEILAISPRTPILLASGYASDGGKLEALLGQQSTVAFIAKPYDSVALLNAAARLLPAHSRAAGSSESTGAA